MHLTKSVIKINYSTPSTTFRDCFILPCFRLCINPEKPLHCLPTDASFRLNANTFILVTQRRPVVASRGTSYWLLFFCNHALFSDRNPQADTLVFDQRRIYDCFCQRRLCIVVHCNFSAHKPSFDIFPYISGRHVATSSQNTGWVFCIHPSPTISCFWSDTRPSFCDHPINQHIYSCICE